MRRLIFTFCLSTTLLYSYEFNPVQLSLIGSYLQNESNISYSDARVFDPNAIREFFDQFHIYQTGPQIEVLVPFAVFFRSFFLYGYGYTHKGLSQMQVVVENSQNIVITSFSNEFRYKAIAYTFNSFGSIGYPIKLAPFVIIPFFGYGYERQNIERKNINFVFFSNDIASANFRPTNHLGEKFYAPFFGLELRLTPTARQHLIWIGEYEFHWGVFKTNSGYFINTQSGRLTQQIKQNILLKKKGYSHRFFLKALIGVSTHSTLGLKLKYSHLKVKKGQSNQTIFKIENDRFTEEKTQRPSNRYTSQYLGGEIDISIQF